MTPLLITSALLVTYSSFVTAQTQCAKKNGVKESCVIYTECDSMKAIIENSTPENQAIFRQAYCGLSGTTAMVCCPTTKCITPDGAQGYCIPPSSCAHVVSMVQNVKPVPQSTRQYVQSLRCDGTGQYNICCSPPSEATTNSRSQSNQKCVLTATPPEPNSKCCGRESDRNGNRIFGGTATGLAEYPWLTVIEYAKDDIIQLFCGGALISGQYVVTAAHCVVGDVLNQGSPVNVRLGEYDTSNWGRDCVPVEGGGTDCNDGAVIVPIEKTIPHPEYRPNSARQKNDIALIRLKRLVEYTAFIRPICLPSLDFTEAPPADLNLYVAGWGAISDTQKASNVKLAVALPYVSNKDCEPSYNRVDRKIRLWDGQFCAGGVNGQDTCKGDSGGPLQRQNGKFKEIVGIVSFGFTPCARENYSGVYTKVYKYIPWITSQITE